MRRRQAFWWILVGAALALVGVGNWQALGGAGQGLRSGGPFWLGAVALLACAAWYADRGRVRGGLPWTRWDAAALLLIGGAATLYRLWAIGRYPPHDAFGFEEFQAAGLAYNTMQDWWGVPLEFPLTNLFPAISFRLFGLSAVALRAPFVLSGIVAPLFLYCALRRVVSRPAAWAGAMLLATNRWAALAARFADEIFFPVSLVAVAAWLLVVTLQERRQLTAVGLAVVAGDFFYAYSGYRAIPIVAFGAAALLAFVHRRRRAEVPVRLFVIVLAVWGAVLSPGATIGGVAGSSLFFEAIERHAEAWGGGRPLGERVAMAAERLAHGWKVFALQGDEWPTLNIPEEPMFDPVTTALASMAVLLALARWRLATRWVPLALVGIQFAALALIPANVNVSRYFVVLVPVFFLTGCLFDDIMQWTSRAGRVVVVGLVVLVAVVNLRNVVRVIDSPVVHAGFQFSENTVLAAIHAVPAGSRVVLLTVEGSVAFEPSDYRWFVAHLHGGRPTSLAAALQVPAGDGEPVYWITQGHPEAHVLPQFVGVACDVAGAQVIDAPKPEASVGVAWVESPGACGTIAPHGLQGVYRVVTAAGEDREIRQVDPLLWMHTIPWTLVWELQDRQLQSLRIEWTGRMRGTVAGDYVLRLEVQGAHAFIRAGHAEAAVTAPAETWVGAEVAVRLDAEPLPLTVRLDGTPGIAPRIRLFWTPPGKAEGLIPPQQLVP